MKSSASAHLLNKMLFQQRLRAASRASLIHFGFCLLIATLVASFVLFVWYPAPYNRMAGGNHLLFILIGVDVVCGPLLTLVVFNPAKPRAELFRDMGVILTIQLAALGYGIYSIWEARPLYLVFEVDRFKVISLPDIDASKLSGLPAEIQPGWLKGPQIVGLRPYQNQEERNKILFESVQHGRDYGEHAEYYTPLTEKIKTEIQNKERQIFSIKKISDHERKKLEDMLQSSDSKYYFLPVMAKNDWIAILNQNTEILNFIEADGFQ